MIRKSFTTITINRDPTYNGISQGTKLLMRGLKHSASGISKKSGNTSARKFQAEFLKSTKKTYGSSGTRKFYKEAGRVKG